MPVAVFAYAAMGSVLLDQSLDGAVTLTAVRSVAPVTVVPSVVTTLQVGAVLNVTEPPPVMLSVPEPVIAAAIVISKPPVSIVPPFPVTVTVRLSDVP
ncbi:MAG: hypothetical protein K6F50_05010, partial [Kiritimatiellae bacterium]|nr:hypothetical protein [Kiritimatiellia bacterium]